MKLRSALARLALAAASVVITAYCLELALTVSGKTWRSANDSADTERRSKRSLVLEMRARGVHAVPSVTPSMLLGRFAAPWNPESATTAAEAILPLGGMPDSTTVLCDETGEFLIYESDLHGFNNPAASWTAGDLSLATVGDSFTHGYCVSAEHHFTGIMRRHYPRMLNLGMAGNGPLLSLATIMEYLAEYCPEVVAWFFYVGNDLIDLDTEKTHPGLMRYLEPGFSQDLLQQRELVTTVLTGFVEAALATRPGGSQKSKTGVFRGFLNLSALRQVVWHRIPRSADFGLLEKVIERARDTVAGWGGELVLVYLPASARAEGSLLSLGSNASRVRRQFFAIAGRLGVEVVDIQSSFAAYDGAEPLMYGHYSETGYRIVADEVLRAIEARVSGKGCAGAGNVSAIALDVLSPTEAPRGHWSREIAVVSDLGESLPRL